MKTVRAAHLPPTELVELGEPQHLHAPRREELDLNPEAAGIAAVVFGHSHKPLVEWRRGCCS